MTITNKQTIQINLIFSGAILPVIHCEDGFQRVPLKPIAEQIGLDWKTQKRKLLNDAYLADRIGFILGEASLPHIAQLGIQRDLYLIRLDRVVAYLSTLNPRNIAARGNHDAAEWLNAKHQEWDNALHDYETLGIAQKSSVKTSDLCKLINAQHKARHSDQKAAFDTLINAALKNMGAPVKQSQPELF